MGRRARDPLAAALDGYIARLERLAPTTLLRIRPQDSAREGQQALALLRPGDRLVACDPRGLALSSEALAALVAAWRRAGVSIGWVVGGAEGLAAAVRRRADRAWSLGPLTLPHRLAQVVVAEQLYRAESILRGSPYHRG